MREEIVKGDVAIMFSAPHCVNHFRNGKIKPREINTDVLIKRLNESENVSIIYKTESDLEDANNDLVSEYRDKCVEFVKENNIKLFLDIHGMDYKRAQDFCIGTAFGANNHGREDLIEIIKNTMIENNYPNVTIDKPFSANNLRCVSTYVAKNCEIPSFQIEINNKYRFNESDSYDMDNLVDTFRKIIRKCKEAL